MAPARLRSGRGDSMRHCVLGILGFSNAFRLAVLANAAEILTESNIVMYPYNIIIGIIAPALFFANRRVFCIILPFFEHKVSLF
ncbi:hypothetical protein LX24_02487 [Desulfallas thermosapovorans DSM 6562]|uniref:Uncharacterized protein n=1 Tax=Desulfallas thermosapovorans DSM 6562 TaxID=1121431 RepID=A0A5S4ZP45_9FIRM|nr:hypothetical protein LX24_02487 [Desulfallas thermosapovorans DSM 6562]